MKSILMEAENLVNGDRQASYGPPEANFKRWMDLCHASGRPGLELLNCEDLAMLMVLLKISRDSHTPKRDNLVDAAAYLWLADRLRGL